MIRTGDGMRQRRSTHPPQQRRRRLPAASYTHFLFCRRLLLLLLPPPAPAPAVSAARAPKGCCCPLLQAGRAAHHLALLEAQEVEAAAGRAVRHLPRCYCCSLAASWGDPCAAGGGGDEGVERVNRLGIARRCR